MSARGFWYLIVAAISISYLINFLELYGKALLIAVLAAIGIFLFGRFVGPKLPVFLGGDPPAKDPPPSSLEWELYLAMSSYNLDAAKACLERGADPHKTFSASHRPSATDARSCYEYAKQQNREDLVSLFESTRIVT